MYLQHFGLSREPFSIAPDPHYLFMSHRHREALAHLLFGVNGSESGGGSGPGIGSGGGFVLLTGDIGTGKTTVCRCFLAQVPANCQVAYIFNPKLSVPELLQTIGEEFHLWSQGAAPSDGSAASPSTSSKAAIDALNAFLLRSHAAGQQCVLVIDEAQNLSAEVLEQLRLLTNLETDERKLLQIILIGQPELRELLARPELEQLAQRVVARFHLDALTEEETSQYIAHRLQVAGLAGPPPFEPAALKHIHRLSGGVPRRINLLCGRALLGAWTLGLHRVSKAVVVQAAEEVFGTPPKAAPKLQTAWPWAALAVAVAATALAVVKGGMLGGWLGSAELAPPAGQLAAASATSALGPANEPGTATAQAGGSAIADLASLFPLMPTDEATAWRELALQWQATLAADAANPCAELAAQGHACYRTPRMNLPLLRQLNRPGILTLQPTPPQQGPTRLAVLVAMDDTTATLQLQGQRHTVLLVALAQAWRGDFATLWQPPPEFGDRLPDGATGPAVAHLGQLLTAVDGQPTPTPATLDAPLVARVRAFQAAHGLTPDGRPGPMTLMQLERATGTDTARLTPTALTRPHVLHP